MKVSKLLGERFKEAPKDCSIASHALMMRGGVCDSDHDSDGYGGRIAAAPECIVGDRRKTE